MALFTPSSTISEIRGSIGSQTYSRNRYRNIIRNRVTPANPNTTFQQASRADLTAAVAAWQALSDANKNRFAVAAKNWNSKSTIDGTKPLSAYNYYIKAFMVQATYGIGTVSSNYIPRVKPRIVLNSIDVQIDRYEIDFDLIGSNTNWYVVFKCNEPVSPGIFSPNISGFTPIAQLPPDVGNNFTDLVAQFEVRFGDDLAAYAGKAIFTEILLYDTLNQVLYPCVRVRDLI